MVYNHPIELELQPKQIDVGMHWVTLMLKNVGSETITGLDINLLSLDTYAISVIGTGKYLMNLKPEEKEAVPFRVSAMRTGKLYVVIQAKKNGNPFFWTSPNIRVKVGRTAAELSSLFVMTSPYPPLGETLKIEANIVGLEGSEGLTLELWAETPSAEFKELAIIETKKLVPGENATYTAEITPREEGLYTVYAYLYDGIERIGYETDVIWVKK